MVDNRIHNEYIHTRKRLKSGESDDLGPRERAGDFLSEIEVISPFRGREEESPSNGERMSEVAGSSR